jgi:hypothetical protein
MAAAKHQLAIGVHVEVESLLGSSDLLLLSNWLLEASYTPSWLAGRWEYRDRRLSKGS